MKKILLIALAFIGLQGVAQEQKKENRKNQHKIMMNLSAEEMATLKTKKMTLFLDLNESQQAKVKSINLENATKRKAMMAERKAEQENGTAKKLTHEERYAMANAKLDHKIEMKVKMKDILNKEQYAKWEKAQMHMAMKGKHKKRGSKKGKDQRI
ncbi:hypothetical protein [uncultured Algibacter sp.]|uniref:hypothetical protein n=1 Tax=uncultured Algibacter sp. TaxID=298659 RepID=UPI00261BD149|nr:hypothetical protein [uncultured Algibacter sp.]